MSKISLDNPLVIKIAFLLFGLIGFIVIEIITEQFNYFSFNFLLLSSLEIFFFIYMAIMLEKKQNWHVGHINPIFASIILIIKIYLLILLLKHGFANSFSGRLSVYGNSFLLGISMATDFILFPLLPLLGSNIFIKKTSLYLWVLSTIISIVFAPSKSVIIGVAASLLFYRFLKRKLNLSKKKIIPLFSIESLIVFIFTIFGTFLFMIYKVGDGGIYMVLHRVAYNFDIAIYASQIPNNIYPEHSNLYYAVLPILKKIDPNLYNLKYYSIPQWVRWESFGISRYGHYGYPNDNLIVGLLLSYKEFGIILFLILMSIFYRYIKYFFKSSHLTLFSLIILFSIPNIFASLQDSAIKFYTFIFVYIVTLFIYFFLPKKSAINANNI